MPVVERMRSDSSRLALLAILLQRKLTSNGGDTLRAEVRDENRGTCRRVGLVSVVVQRKSTLSVG